MITEPAPQTVQRNVKCSMLRSKWMFIEVDKESHVSQSGSDICWCVHTQKCIGPDGRVVTAEACNADRDCFEPL